MRTFKLDKLVRDKIVEIMEGLGQTVEYRTLSDAEYLDELKRKLVEEATEIDLRSEDALKELTDLQEVIDAAVVAIGSAKEDQLVLQHQRAAERGAFNDKLYVDTVSTEDDDKWAEYYAKEPERFPEISKTVEGL